MNNDIIEDYCSYEVAKLLRNLGCEVYSTIGSVTSLYNKKGERVGYTNYGFMLSGSSEGYISAPTHALALKWLRENYNICITVDKFLTTNAGVKWDYSIRSVPINSTNVSWGKNYNQEGSFDSFEEATEVALISVLDYLLAKEEAYTEDIPDGTGSI